MIIDAHFHFGRYHVKPWRTDDAVADLIATARGCGIDRLIVCSLGDRAFHQFPTPEEFRGGNDHVLEEIERYPDILLGYCYVSPLHSAESVDEIRRCVRDVRQDFITNSVLLDVRGDPGEALLLDMDIAHPGKSAKWEHKRPPG